MADTIDRNCVGCTPTEALLEEVMFSFQAKKTNFKPSYHCETHTHDDIIDRVKAIYYRHKHMEKVDFVTSKTNLYESGTARVCFVCNPSDTKFEQLTFSLKLGKMCLLGYPSCGHHEREEVIVQLCDSYDQYFGGKRGESICFLCKPHDLNPITAFDLTGPLFSIEHCGKHTVLAVSAIKDMFRAELGNLIKNQDENGEEEAFLMSSALIKELSALAKKPSASANTTPKQAPKIELPYPRPVDHHCQNQQQQSSGPTATERALLATASILNIATIGAQLEVVKSSLSVVHDILKGLDKNVLPTKMLKEHTNKILKLTKGVVDTVDGKADATGEVEAHEGEEGNGECNGKDERTKEVGSYGEDGG